MYRQLVYIIGLHVIQLENIGSENSEEHQNTTINKKKKI